MPEEYWQRREDDAESRMRARMARVEREHEARRRRLTAAGVVALGIAVTLTCAIVAQAVRGQREARATPAPIASTSSAPAARPAPPVAARPAPPASVAATDAAPAPAPAATLAAPRPAPKPKPAPTRKPRPPAPKPEAKTAPPSERVRIDVGAQGYEPSVVRVSAGARVTVTVGKGEGCAAGFLMPDLGIEQDNSRGPVTFTIGPLKPGTYRFTCGMEMVEGRMVVG